MAAPVAEFADPLSRPLQMTKSFSRFEPSPSPLGETRSRASTVSISPLRIDKALPIPQEQETPHGTDVFEKASEAAESNESLLEQSQTLPERFDELPVELASLTDRFVDSLSAKVYTEPPTIDVLSDLFQEFYNKANAHIATHISALSARLGREASPAPRATRNSSLSRTSRLKKQASNDSVASQENARGEQQLLTASEVTQKRKAKRMLELKRAALEEAVEKRTCEKVYPKIWRHKSTLDEVRDEKLRSKQAALALVGIGMKDLGIDIGDHAENGEETVKEWLAPAREALAQMDREMYPLAKLQSLQSAHKSIVETLSKFHPSSSSADEILPTMIFTLITCPPEGINVISNLCFTERFRNVNKIDGEAAYCMTNLAAAISFLENVDLSSLRADEPPEGPAKSSTASTAAKDRPGPITNVSASSATSLTMSEATPFEIGSKATVLKPAHSMISPPAHMRRISNPFQQATKAIGNANDAVRNTAEEGFKNISSTLDNSFKFLFGRMKEHNEEKVNVEVVMPRTLDDARRLVSPITEDGGTVSDNSSVADLPTDLPDGTSGTKPDDKLLSLVGGRKAAAGRDRSVDSNQSNGSGKRAIFAATGSSSNVLTAATAAAAAASAPIPNAFDSMKNFGTTLNPLAHLSALGGGLRGFAASKPATPPAPAASDKPRNLSRSPPPGSGSLQISTKHLDDPDVIKFEPPIQRFLEIHDIDQLKLGDMAELLRDYHRLASVLGQLSKSSPSSTTS